MKRAIDALRGMVGLVQLAQERYPDFPVDNHRVIEAMSALKEAETTPPEALQNADTARLDALEKDVNERGPLLLHNLRVTGNFRGLGLASTGRSLRKAIDDMAPHAVSVPSPLAQKQEKL